MSNHKNVVPGNFSTLVSRSRAMTNKIRLATLFTAIIVVLASNAHATTLLNVIDGPIINRNDYSGTVGVEFTMNTAFRITALGVQDGELVGGLVSTHDVGVWNLSGDLLATVEIQSGTASPLDGAWRYETLATPVILAAGTYHIGAEFFSSGDPWTDTTTTYGGDNTADFGINALATLDGNRHSGVGFNNPTFNTGAPLGRMAPANLQFDAIPEPTSAVLLGFGVMGLVIPRRRRERFNRASNR